MTELAIKTLARWTRLPNGSMRRPSLTCDNNRICLSTGERFPHSHYAWAKNETWAAYGDLMGDSHE